MDSTRMLEHKFRNALQSLFLLGMMGLLVGGVGYLIAGWIGFVIACVSAVVLALTALPGASVMFRGGRRLHPSEAPDLYMLLGEVSRRAGLGSAPVLVYVPTPGLMALTTGREGDACIAVTDGLLRALDRDELRGVLAHEVSHLANNDVWLMALGTTFLRVTSSLSRVGLFLLLINIPILAAFGTHIPWAGLILLFLAPTLSSLLVLSLSRTREFEADLDAARLCNGPDGLISALVKIERSTLSLWERVLNVRLREALTPVFLRTHPPTEERIRRLRMVAVTPGGGQRLTDGVGPLHGFGVLGRADRPFSDSVYGWRALRLRR